VRVEFCIVANPTNGIKNMRKWNIAEEIRNKAHNWDSAVKLANEHKLLIGVTENEAKETRTFHFKDNSKILFTNHIYKVVEE
jgi:hypothetical protein